MDILWPPIAFGLLTLHLLAVQLAAAGPVVACWLPRSTAAPHAHASGKRLVNHSMLALVIGTAAGLLLGWLAMVFSHRDYQPVLTQFHDRIWWGIWELVFSMAMLLAIQIPWSFWSATPGRRIAQGVLVLLGAANLLYHFPPLLTVIASQLRDSGALLETAPITSAQYRSLIAQPVVLAKSLHFTFASFAVTGAWVMLTQPVVQQPGTGDPAKRGATIALVSMGIQMLVGMWLVMLAPSNEQSALMGNDLIATGILLASIAGSLAVMNQLANVAMDARLANHALKTRIPALGVLAIATLMIGVTLRLSGLAE